MKRRAMRRSRRFNRIFRFHPGFGGLRTSLLTAMGATLALEGCLPSETRPVGASIADATVGSTSTMVENAGMATSNGMPGPSMPAMTNAGAESGGTVSLPSVQAGINATAAGDEATNGPVAGAPSNSAAGIASTGGQSASNPASSGGEMAAGSATSIAGTQAAGQPSMSAGQAVPSAGVRAQAAGRAAESAGHALLGGAASGGQIAPAAGEPVAGGAAVAPMAGEPGAGGAAVAPASICIGAEGLLDPNGQPTGVEQCPDGSKNRVEVVACAPIVAGPACDPNQIDPDWRSCDTDLDCNEKPHGRCIQQLGGFAPPSCGCRYACETDADCDAGRTCVCAGVDGSSSRCVRSSCSTNDQCPSGDCAVQTTVGCAASTFVHCRSDNDTCKTNEDCRERNESCSYQGDGFSCQPVPVCGRPLVVHGVSRLGTHTDRDDWLTGAAPRTDHLSPEECVQLTAWWLEVAALEYASVASFSRFSLHLMSLGAPPELLADTQRATLDEIEHARLAYGMASAYSESPLGPAPFDISGVEIETNLENILRGLLEEACIGEILGAAEARVAASRAIDPVVQAVYSQIASDEEQHAQLAWRSLQWLLTTHPSLHKKATEWLYQIIDEHLERAVDASIHRPEIGLIGAVQRQAIFEEALLTVVIPCAQGLGLRRQHAA